MKQSTHRLSRRSFLARAATTVAAFQFIPSRLLWGQDTPSKKLNIAGIGIGGQGGGNLRMCNSENIVALCDVDAKYAANTLGRYPQAKRYKDYRVMLEQQKDIDAVVIATPDHTHAVITLAAMQAGKHVYCQKPLTHTVHEARKITEAAGRYKVRTQMGNQGHSDDHIRLVREWVQAGAIGDVKEIHAWTDRPSGKPWYANFAVQELPQGEPPVPDTLDWDLWLGPARQRKYHPAYCPFKWRAWIDFGTGALGDMGCHILDPSFWALDLKYPTSVLAEIDPQQPELRAEAFPASSKVIFEFPARGPMPPLKLTWFDGQFKMPRPPMLEPGHDLPESGAVIFGEKQTLLHDSHGADGLRVIPEARMKDFKRPEKTIPRIKGNHEQDWVRACKDGRPACSPFEYGGPLTEMLLVGLIAMRLPGEKLLWDGPALRFTNNDKANELVHIPYRAGWTL